MYRDIGYAFYDATRYEDALTAYNTYLALAGPQADLEVYKYIRGLQTEAPRYQTGQ